MRWDGDWRRYRSQIASIVHAHAHRLYYATPSFHSPPSVSENVERWRQTLRRDGILKISLPSLEAAALQFADESDAILQNPIFARDVRTQDLKSFGVRHCYALSFRIPTLFPLWFDRELATFAQLYLRRRPGFRNPPIYQEIVFTPDMDSLRGHGNRFHNDALHQLSWMLLLEDTDMNSTHLEYAVGTHRRGLGFDGMHLSPEHAERLAERCDRVTATGPAGTLYVFDAFGIHRRVLKTGRRRMIHCNLNTGHWKQPFWDRLGDWPRLHKEPKVVSQLFRWAT